MENRAIPLKGIFTAREHRGAEKENNKIEDLLVKFKVVAIVIFIFYFLMVNFNQEDIMSEFDQLIADVASEMKASTIDVNEKCQKTLRDYQCLDTIDPSGVGGGLPLRMIAWDQA